MMNTRWKVSGLGPCSPVPVRAGIPARLCSFTLWGLLLGIGLCALPLYGCGGSGPAPRRPGQGDGAGAGGKLRAGERYVKEPVFGRRVLIRELGTAHPDSVVLVHGVGSLGSRIWDKTVPHLAERYHVVAMDLPGFGRSERGNALYSPPKLAAFVRWVIQRYARGHGGGGGQVILVGHSLGGAISLYTAARYPKLMHRLVLVDAAGILHRLALTEFLASLRPGSKWGKKLATAFEHPLSLMGGVMGQGLRLIERKSLPKTLDAALRSATFRRVALDSDANLIGGLALLRTEYTPLFSRVAADTTLLWGARDVIAPPRTAHVLAARLPRAGLRLIPGAAHSPMLEAPRRFHRLLDAALAGRILPAVGTGPGAAVSTAGARESTAGARESTAGARESTAGARESTKPDNPSARGDRPSARGDRPSARRTPGARVAARAPVPPPPPATAGARHAAADAQRVGRCRDARGLVFTGRYQRIEITNCTRVRLEAVEARELRVRRSEVTVVRSRLGSGEVALRAKGSTVTLTAVDLQAEVALRAQNTKLDLAGVHLTGRRRALRLDAASSALFSVSRMRDPQGERTLHGPWANLRK
jgi:pimeloyl-ACP methyl ester carboxylesterase